MRRQDHRWMLAGVVAAALVAVNACGSSYSPMSPSGGGVPADVTITIVGDNGNLSFSPNPGVVPVGKTVAWRNADSTTHDPTADGGSFAVGPIAPGSTSSPVMMTTAGSFPYHCSIHPTMVGSLTVQ